MEKKFELSVGDIKIEGERKRVKNLHLRITQTGKVKMSVPVFVSDAEIKKFAADKYEWLKKHLETAKTETFWKYDQAGQVRVFGQTYALKYNAAKNGIRGGDFLLKGCFDPAETALKRELKKLLRDKIAARLPFWEKRTGLKASSFVIRDMTTRWGTCNTKTRRLCFNLQLVKKAEECLDYIIVHELGHILNRFHDKRFYNYLNYNFPDYKRVKKLLSQP